MKLQNKLVVVTGGVSGLGAATVKHVHNLGAHVAIIDLQLPKGIAASSDSRLKYFEADITNTDHIQKAVTEITAWANSQKLRIAAVVCCAGLLGPAKILSKDGRPIPLEKFKKTVEVSLFGTVDVIRQLLPQMASQTPDEDGERGVLITVASAAAFDGQEGQAAYSAAKGAIASMTLPLARDLSSRGIRAVCIAPGLFETVMTATMPEKAKLSLQRTLEFPPRGGRPEEFASLVEQVIDNHMLNGTVIRLDGAARMPSRM
ncbi:hypothetical protein BX600DRAFT_513274 [Xylariales sp. PMI_506]|nr:hypothetical protein BX600DRAFT_513274 [Xylariales sp. PMI_506]